MQKHHERAVTVYVIRDQVVKFKCIDKHIGSQFYVAELVNMHFLVSLVA